MLTEHQVTSVSTGVVTDSAKSVTGFNKLGALCAEDSKRLAAAANANKLKKLHSDARRDSKFVKKKLQRQQDSGLGSRGSKEKVKEDLPELVPEEIDGLLKRESSQSGTQNFHLYWEYI